MSDISISQLKTHPSKALREAVEYPVAIKKRNEVKAYLIGKDLYEKIVSYIEDYIDRRAVETVNFTKGKDFEKVAEELGL